MYEKETISLGRDEYMGNERIDDTFTHRVYCRHWLYKICLVSSIDALVSKRIIRWGIYRIINGFRTYSKYLYHCFTTEKSFMDGTRCHTFQEKSLENDSFKHSHCHNWGYYNNYCHKFTRWHMGK